MRAIGLEDILGRERYGQTRDTVRRRVIDHKRTRRITVGDQVTLVFEDRATVWYQTQEMLWVEHITDLDAIREELQVYNELLPSRDELAATLLIEIANQERMREQFQRLLGLDRHVHLEVGGRRITASFEGGRQTDDKISAVQYVRFPLDAAAGEALRGGSEVAIVIDHPNYRARTALPEPARASIVEPFFDPTLADAALRRVRDGN